MDYGRWGDGEDEVTMRDRLRNEGCDVEVVGVKRGRQRVTGNQVK